MQQEQRPTLVAPGSIRLKFRGTLCPSNGLEMAEARNTFSVATNEAVVIRVVEATAGTDDVALLNGDDPPVFSLHQLESLGELSVFELIYNGAEHSRQLRRDLNETTTRKRYGDALRSIRARIDDLPPCPSLHAMRSILRTGELALSTPATRLYETIVAAGQFSLTMSITTQADQEPREFFSLEIDCAVDIRAAQ